jgi:hypothetical protein
MKTTSQLPLESSSWSEAELQALYKRYLEGAFISGLAKCRHRKASDLRNLFIARGWEILPKKKYTLPMRRLPDELIDSAYADYQAGMRLSDVERKYQRGKGTLRASFVYRGLALRKSPRIATYRKPDGTFAPIVPKTEQEIESLIRSATRIVVPAELLSEWRRWDLARRGDFISRLRVRLADPTDRPLLPFSANVIPFDYATPAAWEIVKAANSGTISRTARMKIDIRSQGVIYKGDLWFWSRTTGPAYFKGGDPWRPHRPRPSLHRTIYEEHFGPIPAGHVVSHLDRNDNNLDPSNLILRTKNDIARLNQAAAITRKSREKTALLLARAQRKNKSNDLIQHLAPH